MINKVLYPVVICIVLMAVIITYSLFDPATNAYFPGCPFYKGSGLYCPGCGAQRALHYLLAGNITAAFKANMLLVVFTPLLIIYYSVILINNFNKKKLIVLPLVNNLYFIYGVAAIIILFWIVRNLPFSWSKIFAPH